MQQLLFGSDIVITAIERLREFEPSEGYWVAISGGKDSTVIYDLVGWAGVRAEYHHSLTTIDAPETVHYIREYQSLCQIDRPKKPLLRAMIEDEKSPPTRLIRWCCRKYKERGGAGRVVVTGIRTAESTRRKSRRIVERCYKDKSKTFVNPIIDWTEADVWQYIHERRLPYNPVYDYGFRRVGCVLCPMVRDRDIARQRYYWPRLYDYWHRSVIKCWHARKEAGLPIIQDDPEDYWLFWLDRDSRIHRNGDGQMMLFW